MKSSFSDVVSDFSLFRYRMNLRLHKKKKNLWPTSSARQLMSLGLELRADVADEDMKGEQSGIYRRLSVLTLESR